MTTERKPYEPPAVHTVECYCDAENKLILESHRATCPVARLRKFRILKPYEFVRQYGDALRAILTELGHRYPQSFQILADLDLMFAPICPRCYERDGSLVQTEAPLTTTKDFTRRLCLSCSRDQEP